MTNMHECIRYDIIWIKVSIFWYTVYVLGDTIICNAMTVCTCANMQNTQSKFLAKKCTSKLGMLVTN